MDARKLYESYLCDFTITLNSIEEAVPKVLRLPVDAGFDDVHDVRLLAEKSADLLKHIETVIAAHTFVRKDKDEKQPHKLDSTDG